MLYCPSLVEHNANSPRAPLSPSIRYSTSTHNLDFWMDKRCAMHDWVGLGVFILQTSCGTQGVVVGFKGGNLGFPKAHLQQIARIVALFFLLFPAVPVPVFAKFGTIQAIGAASPRASLTQRYHTVTVQIAIYCLLFLDVRGWWRRWRDGPLGCDGMGWIWAVLLYRDCKGVVVEDGKVSVDDSPTRDDLYG